MLAIFALLISAKSFPYLMVDVLNQTVEQMSVHVPAAEHSGGYSLPPLDPARRHYLWTSGPRDSRKQSVTLLLNFPTSNRTINVQARKDEATLTYTIDGRTVTAISPNTNTRNLAEVFQLNGLSVHVSIKELQGTYAIGLLVLREKPR